MAWPRFRRVQRLSSGQHAITLSLPGSPVDGQTVTVQPSELQAMTLGEFCEHCRAVLGKGFPTHWSFWQITPDGLRHRPSMEAWQRQVQTQLDICEELEKWWHRKQRAAQAHFDTATQRQRAARDAEIAALMKDMEREPAELTVLHARQRANTANGERAQLEADQHKAEAEMRSRWAYREAGIDDRYKDYTAEARMAYDEAIARFDNDLETEWEQMNREVPPEKPPRPAPQPGRGRGRPRGQRLRAIELLRAKLPATADVVRDEGQAEGISFNTMDRAATELGVIKTPRGNGGSLWRLP